MGGVYLQASIAISNRVATNRGIQIVAEGSAGLSGRVAEVILEADHSTICRFDHPGSDYSRVTKAIEKLLNTLQARILQSQTQIEATSAWVTQSM